MDAVDAVMLDIQASSVELITSGVFSIPDQIRDSLLATSSTFPSDPGLLAELDVSMGELFATAALELIKQAGVSPSRILAIGSHGQTIRHQPAGISPYTLQIGDPNIVAERTHITTVADFRRRDVAAGGQGAPLVPAFHRTLFQTPRYERVVVNIGGMANITILPREETSPVLGFDTGPGNVLLDAWIREHLALPMDRDGLWAGSGLVHEDLLQHFLQDPFFAMASPKSTGREYFNLKWIQQNLSALGAPVLERDVQRTLCELSVTTIAQAINQYAESPHQVLVCGGGAYNPLLMQGLTKRLNSSKVQSTAAYGLAPEWVEAAAFAWLAKRTLDGLPGNLPSVTGAAHPVVLGGIYQAGPAG